MDVARLFDNVASLAGVRSVWLLDADTVLHVRPSRSERLARVADKARPHVRALFAAADSSAAGSEDAVLRFANGCALLRRSGPYALVVVTEDDSALNAVRMVSNLLLRNLTPESVAALNPAPQPPPASLEVAQPATARAPRMYRGQPY